MKTAFTDNVHKHVTWAYQWLHNWIQLFSEHCKAANIWSDLDV